MTESYGSHGPMAWFGQDRIVAEVGRVLALEAAERAFRALEAGSVEVPPPLGLELPEMHGEVHVKGAWIQGAPVVALKVATGFYRNADRGLPTGSGLVLLLDATTGFPRVLLEDGGYLTELRTAAAGALAATHMTSGSLGRVAFVGAGTQARFQLLALAEVRRLETVVGWSPNLEKTRAWADEMDAGLGLGVRAVSSVREAVTGADLVVTVTPSRAPLVWSEWLEPDATVLAVGSDGPGKQELDPDVLGEADKVIVDDLDQCARLGELQHALAAGVMTREDVYATLGEVVAGTRAGREGGERIVCDLTGVGAQDAAMAEAAWAALAERSSSL